MYYIIAFFVPFGLVLLGMFVYVCHKVNSRSSGWNTLGKPDSLYNYSGFHVDDNHYHDYNFDNDCDCGNDWDCDCND